MTVKTTYLLSCSFCGTPHAAPRLTHMIAGPNGVSICNECVDMCVDIMKAEPVSLKETHKDGADAE